MSSETLSGVTIMSVLNCVLRSLVPYVHPCLAIPRAFSRLFDYYNDDNNNNNNNNNDINNNNSTKNKNFSCYT